MVWLALQAADGLRRAHAAMRTRRLTMQGATPYPRLMIVADGIQNLHTLASYGGPLGVECRCGRRALVPPEAVDAHPGNMREIRSLPFVCRECGSRQWRGFIFGRHDDALGWARRVSERSPPVQPPDRATVAAS